MTTILGESRSVKKILYPGKHLPAFTNGAKLKFHFKSSLLNDDDEVGSVLDDSRQSGRPMELIVGKQFKLPVWEECLKTMRVNEVCQLDISKQHSLAYPMVSKSYRQFAGLIKKEEFNVSCCGMAALQKGIGQTDLDKLIHTPQKLRFVLELLEVQEPGDYEKESWSMTPEEKLQSIPQLKEDGNMLYNSNDFKGASEKYFEALTRLEQLMLREKPDDDEWLDLEKMKRPLLLNYAQCKLKDEDYYPVIEHTSQVLQYEPDNVKALFKRAKAYAGVWDLAAARNDFHKILDLDASLTITVRKELLNLDSLAKQKDTEDKAKYAGKLF